jgi:cobalt/nickel transport system permease protein
LIDLYRPKISLIHATDARVKLILTLGFIVCLSLLPAGAWPAYVLFLAVSISAAVLSRLGVDTVLGRALISLPFVLAALPLLFSGPAPYNIFPLYGFEIQISQSGLARFLSIALKSWIAVQAAVVLAGSTPFNDLLAAMQQLKVPRLFVAIVALMWRYLFVLVDEVIRMLRARSSRSAPIPGTGKAGGSMMWRARVTGGMAGSLFLRSLERSDRVYAAMLARGYNGSLPVGRTAPLSRGESFLLPAGLVVLALMTLVGLFTGSGV